MVSTNLRPDSLPLRTPTTLRVSNPTDGSETDGSEVNLLPERTESHGSCSECDTDDLSLKEHIRWRAGVVSPFTLESYPKPKTPSSLPPQYFPPAQLALCGVNSSYHQQEAEELDVNYFGILSPPPRVFHNPHPSYHDYDVPDRFSVRDFLEASGPEDVEENARCPPLEFHNFGVGIMRPPTRALQPTKPLQIRRRKRLDPPAMYRDPSSQLLGRSFSSYSQDSAPHVASQYRPSPQPQPMDMEPGVSTTGSGTYPSPSNSLFSSHIYFHEPGGYPSSTRSTASVVQAGASSPNCSQYHRSRRRGPPELDKHGLPLIDEQKESTFTPADSQYPRNDFPKPGWHYPHRELLGSQVPPTPRQSTVPPHPWISDTDENRKHPQQTTISRQPGHHPPMGPKRRIGNRNAKCMPYSSDGKRDWSSDLCMFCDHNLGTCEFFAANHSSGDAGRKIVNVAFFRLRRLLVPMYHLREEQKPHRVSLRGGKGASQTRRYMLRRLRHTRVHVCLLSVRMGDSSE